MRLSIFVSRAATLVSMLRSVRRDRLGPVRSISFQHRKSHKDIAHEGQQQQRRQEYEKDYVPTGHFTVVLKVLFLRRLFRPPCPRVQALEFHHQTRDRPARRVVILETWESRPLFLDWHPWLRREHSTIFAFVVKPVKKRHSSHYTTTPRVSRKCSQCATRASTSARSIDPKRASRRSASAAA